MIIRFMKYSMPRVLGDDPPGVTATQCFECEGRLEVAETGQLIVHVNIKDDHRPFDAIEVQADLTFLRREYRAVERETTLRSVYIKCGRCGHSKNLHEHHRDEPRCLYTDSEGQCPCGGFHVYVSGL